MKGAMALNVARAGVRRSTRPRVMVADDAVTIDGVRAALPLASGAAPEPRTGEPRTRIEYVFRPTDTLDMSFPQPEGGLVTVVYPIIFQPGS